MLRLRRCVASPIPSGRQSGTGPWRRPSSPGPGRARMRSQRGSRGKTQRGLQPGRRRPLSRGRWRRSPPRLPRIASRLLLQLCSGLGWDVREGRRLAQLKRPDVGDDGPAVWHRYLSGVRRHGAEAVCDHVEEVAHWRLAEAVGMVAGRCCEAALHHHPITIADVPVTRGTVNLEALPTTVQDRARDWKRKLRRILASFFSCKEQGVVAQLASSNRVGRKWTGGGSIGKQSARLVGTVARLVGHLLPARTDQKREPRQHGDHGDASHTLTHTHPRPRTLRAAPGTAAYPRGQSRDRVPRYTGRSDRGWRWRTPPR